MSTTTVKTVAILVAKPSKAEELKSLLDGMVMPSRDEPGNLRYDLWLDKANPSRFVLDEFYSDEVALATHHATPHFQNYLSKINDLADRTVILLAPLQVASGTIDSESLIG